MFIDDRLSRRTILQGIGAASFGLAGVGTAASGNEVPIVPAGTARTAVEAHVKNVVSRPESEFDDWKDAKVGNSTVFHARSGTEYSPSAYLFELEGPTSTVGYVTASARKDWAPILEYSTASPPTKRIEATKSMMDQRGGSLTGRKLYLGGMKYGLELAGGSRVGLRSGRIESISSRYDPRELQFDPENVEE